MGTTTLIGTEGGREDPRLPNDNAPYASLRPRLTDHAVHLATRALPPLWRACGWRTASGALRHYLRGTGRPYRLDARALLALPVVRTAVDEQLDIWRERAADLPPGTYPADTGWRGVAITRHDDTDLWLALRGVSYRLRGTVEVRADRTPGQVTYRFEAHKSWNFDRGEAEYGIPFTPFARLHETGLAREFDAVGELDGLVDGG
ncbi:hypothetical protein [Streptomyces indicus]|uniref:Uncharacterized protein n=1 Tax=Streptomyces indicus TaxID=417292 RepID=A0A1G9DJJ9_9ACTN|nr:hypothetical protein [Streptomyces indicus]SDK64006.1 hypothetical protein SAMN05421806_109272 [Streptomyces indicus]